MANPRISDDTIRDLIIMTVEPGDGTGWKKFEERFGKSDLLPRFKQTLKDLQKSGHICLEGRIYRLTKKGLEKYEVLNSETGRSIYHQLIHPK